MKFSAFTFGVLALLACRSTAIAQASTTQPTPPPLLIGVWQQPVENFALWQARGINTLVEIPTPASAHPPAAWVAAAEAAGLWEIRVPVGALSADNGTPHLLAWNQPDEPEGAGATPASTCAANYAAWHAVNPHRPVFINFDASRVLGIQGGLTAASYAPYLPCADWIGSDIYPVTDWGRPDWIDHPGLSVSTLSGWTGGKPQFAFIETSNQRIGPSQQATAPQVRYETWHAIICGATGIFYFPEQFNPFNFDGTPLDVVAEITALNADLNSVGPYLAHAKPLNIGAGYECITSTQTINGAPVTFTLLLNSTPNTVTYFGTQLAPYGVFATLTDKVPATVLAHTAIPPTVDQEIAALQAQQAADHATVQALSTALANVAKAIQGAQPATQP